MIEKQTTAAMSTNSEDATSPKGSNSDHVPARKYVPNDITISILARLPVKSLLRFSCVSKTWNALLRTPKFISEHRQKYNGNQNNNNSSHIIYLRFLPKQENDGQTICTVLDERDSLKKSGFVLLPFIRYVKSLARFLVKNLLRFSWIAKAWNALFGTPQFITEHHKVCKINQNNNSSNNLVYTRLQKQETGWRTILLDERDGLVKSNFEFPFMRVVNYCDGLILFQSCGLYYIWNPLVGILKGIGGGGLPELSGYTVVVGFGFAERSGDYRVLKIRFTSTERLNWSHEVEMYSLAADRWTIIEGGCGESLLFWDNIEKRNVVFKGSIYFVARVRDGIGKHAVLRFDLDEEVFSELALPLAPPFCNLGYGRHMLIPSWYLVVLGGDTLAFLRLDVWSVKMHVWLWLWNQDSTSWTAQTHHFSTPPLLSVVSITNAGQIVMEPRERRSLFIYGYDANHREFKLTILETCDIPQAMYSHGIIPINKESLFLMDRDKEDILLFTQSRGNPRPLSLIRHLIRSYVIHQECCWHDCSIFSPDWD